MHCLQWNKLATLVYSTVDSLTIRPTYSVASTLLLSIRSTQPCIPPGLLNRVPAGGRECQLCQVAGNTVWSHVTLSSRIVAVWQPCELLYTCYLLTYGTLRWGYNKSSIQTTDRYIITATHDFVGYPVHKQIRYDTRCYFNVRSKADISQLNLPHGPTNKRWWNTALANYPPKVHGGQAEVISKGLLHAMERDQYCRHWPSFIML